MERLPFLHYSDGKLYGFSRLGDCSQHVTHEYWFTNERSEDDLQLHDTENKNFWVFRVSVSWLHFPQSWHFFEIARRPKNNHELSFGFLRSGITFPQIKSKVITISLSSSQNFVLTFLTCTHRQWNRSSHEWRWYQFWTNKGSTSYWKVTMDHPLLRFDCKERRSEPMRGLFLAKVDTVTTQLSLDPWKYSDLRSQITVQSSFPWSFAM